MVFCKHVDAGKSTIDRQLMFLTRQVNKRILEKYQNEAREKSCRSWPFPLVKRYSVVLHIHVAVGEVQLKKLIRLINSKTSERIQEHSRFMKQDQVAIARFELSHSGQAICMEPFKRAPQLGRFTLRDKDRAISVEKVLKVIK
ncbi:unnamed protein product [Rotaria sordida]|uniref:GTP-eEF1A C-terminal domain-containing protein n=2 Tax=Rotaria sordida TaxID=392033 RepID=A0A814UNU1_9BILA|nr:unnamed protein product [Rotaria sordida]